MQECGLSGAQQRFLRGLGMELEPVVQIGKQGVTETVVASAREALAARELIKVRALQNCPAAPKDAAALLAERVGAALVQVIGRNGLLYKANPEKGKIILP